MWESGSSGHPLRPTYCRFLGHGLGLSLQGKEKTFKLCQTEVFNP